MTVKMKPPYYKPIFNVENSGNDLEKEIEISKYILKLEENFDGEGSTSYKEATWSKAVNLLRHYSWTIESRYSYMMPIPKILHGLEGSIDLHWRNEGFEFLLTIYPDSDIAEYYGDDYLQEKIKGTINLKKEVNGGLLLWLMKK